MPMARQACTNSRSRSDRNSARVMRAIGVQLTMPMAITMLLSVEPRITTMVSTKIRLGMVWNSSAARMHDLVDPAAEIAGDGADA